MTTYDTAKVTIPVSPLLINELKFYTDPSYSQILPTSKQADFYNKLYIQATGSDLNEYNADTVGVILQDASIFKKNNTGLFFNDIETYVFIINNLVHFSLIETGKHTGIFRGEILIGPDNSDREEIGKVIGSSRGNTILLFWENDFIPWHNYCIRQNPIVNIITADTPEPVLRAKVKMIQFDQPDFIRELNFMKNESFNEILRSPHLTLSQTLESNIPELKFIYLRALGDTQTASDLLEDTFDVVIKIYKADTFGIIDYQQADIDDLKGRADIGIDSDSFDVLNIRMVEVGPNSGIYTNRDDVKSIISQKEYPTLHRNLVIDQTKYAHHLLVAEPVIRHTFDAERADAFAGKRPPTNKAEPNIYASDTSYIAFYISPIRIDAISIYESNNYINILTPSERTAEIPFNKLYIKATESGYLPDTWLGSLLINDYSNDVLRDEIFINLYINPKGPQYQDFSSDTFKAEYGNDTYLEIKLVETAVASNVYIVDVLNIPTLVTRYDVNTPNYTDPGRKLLHILKGDTIEAIAYNKISQSFVSEKVVLFSSATNRYPELIGIKLMNSSFNGEDIRNLLPSQNMYIQAYGSPGKSSALLIDTVPIQVKNQRTNKSLVFYLTETAVSSEIYRIDIIKFNYPRLDEYSLFTDNILEAQIGDTIEIVCTGSINVRGEPTFALLTRNMASPRSPTIIFNVRAAKDNSGLIKYQPTERFAHNTDIFIEISGDIGDNALVDQTGETHVYVQNARGQRIYVTCTEDGPATGKYRGRFKLTYLTNDTLDEIGMLQNETFAIYHVFYPDTPTEYRMAIPEPPSVISSIGLKDAGYTQSLSFFSNNTVLPGEKLYIELNGEDKNPNIIDAIEIYAISWELKTADEQSNKRPSSSPVGWITIKLTETEKNIGKFKGTVQLGDYNDTDQKMLLGHPEFVLAVIAKMTLDNSSIAGFSTVYEKVRYYAELGYADTAFIPIIKSPTRIFGISLKTSDYSKIREVNSNNPLHYGELLYIEVQGDVANDLLVDTTRVELRGYDINKNIVSSVMIELIETAKNSGTYRGKVLIAEEPYIQSIPASIYYTQTTGAGAPKSVVVFDNLKTPIFGPGKAVYFDIISLDDKSAVFGGSSSEFIIDNSPTFNVFPNPWKPGANSNFNGVHTNKTLTGIYFTGLSSNAGIAIYDQLGRIVFKGQSNENSSEYNYSKFLWDGLNNGGIPVSSGVYIYITQDKYGSTKKGKIAIIR